MQILSAKDINNSFGLLLDQAGEESAQVEKGGGYLVGIVQELQRLSLVFSEPLGDGRSLP